MKKITLLVLACTLCASVGFAQNKKALRAKTMKVENTEAVSSRLFTPVYKFTKAQVTSTPRMLANDASAVIVEEDFSKFTAGSETAPDATDLANAQKATSRPITHKFRDGRVPQYSKPAAVPTSDSMKETPAG